MHPMRSGMVGASHDVVENCHGIAVSGSHRDEEEKGQDHLGDDGDLFCSISVLTHGNAGCSSLHHSNWPIWSGNTAFTRVAFISALPEAPISSSPTVTILIYMVLQPARPSQRPSRHFRKELLRHHNGHHFMQHSLGFLSTTKITEPSPFGSEISQSP